MERGNGKSIPTHAMTNRHPNVIKTHHHPVFFVYSTIEARMHPHVKKHACAPTKKTACTHMSACASANKRYFAGSSNLGMLQICMKGCSSDVHIIQ